MAWLTPDPRVRALAQTGVSVATVHKVISQYNQIGVAALETPGKGGRYNSYLTREQEKEFLAKFFEQAAKGQISTVTQIKIAYEQLLGHPVHKTTIYRLLDRHHWRKIVPRPCYFIIMQVDRAGWHLSKSLQIPENIRLLPQPSHSPELMLLCTYQVRHQGKLFLQSHLEIDGQGDRHTLSGTRRNFLTLQRDYVL